MEARACNVSTGKREARGLMGLAGQLGKLQVLGETPPQKEKEPLREKPNIDLWVPYILLHMQIHSHVHTRMRVKLCMTHTCGTEITNNKRAGRKELNSTTEALVDYSSQ